jgi:hypothetical protein
VGNLIFNLQNQFPKTKIILNSITFCPSVQKLRNNQQSTPASPELPNGTESRTTFVSLFLGGLMEMNIFGTRKRGGGDRLSNNRPYG